MFSTSDVIIGDIPDYEEEEVFSKTSSLAIFPVQHVFRERIFYHSTEHNFTSLEEAKYTIVTETGFRRYIRTKIDQDPNPNRTLNRTFVVEDQNRTFVVEDHNRTFVVGTDTIEDNETRRATFTVIAAPALNVTFTM